jgi:hypothetical protein
LHGSRVDAAQAMVDITLLFFFVSAQSGAPWAGEAPPCDGLVGRATMLLLVNLKKLDLNQLFL